jgi:hypothetical protein
MNKEIIDEDGFVTIYQTPTNAQLAAKRLGRKLDILRLDAKNRGNTQIVQDLGECLSLLEIIMK